MTKNLHFYCYQLKPLQYLYSYNHAVIQTLPFYSASAHDSRKKIQNKIKAQSLRNF